jgi:hypothetical protein
MKNYNYVDLLRDFDFVRRALRHKENTKHHLVSLRNLVEIFDKKHANTHSSPSYIAEAYRLWNKIDTEIYDKHLNEKYEV